MSTAPLELSPFKVSTTKPLPADDEEFLVEKFLLREMLRLSKLLKAEKVPVPAHPEFRKIIRTAWAAGSFLFAHPWVISYDDIRLMVDGYVIQATRKRNALTRSPSRA